MKVLPLEWLSSLGHKSLAGALAGCCFNIPFNPVLTVDSLAETSYKTCNQPSLPPNSV